MPVDWRAQTGQKAIRPVSDFYAGKAVRADIALREKQTERLEQEIESAPVREELARQKQALDLAKYNRETAKFLKELDDDKRDATLSSAYAYKEFLEGDPDNVEGASEAFYSAAASHGFSPKDMFGEKIVIPPQTVGAIVASDVDSQRKRVGQPTADEKLIDSLDIPEDKKQALLKAIAVKKGTVVGRTPEDVAADPRTPSQRGAAYQEKVAAFDTSSDVQEMISNTLPEISKLPNTVGASGKIAMGGAGLLSVLKQDAAAEAFAEFVAGADAETISAMQVQLQTIRGRIIPLVTGEQGKRLSEMEREIASRAVGLIDQIQGIADFTKAYPQVIGSLKQLYEESWATKYRAASQDENINYPYDLTTKEGIHDLLQEFSVAGIDKDSAKRAVTRMQTIQAQQ